MERFSKEDFTKHEEEDEEDNDDIEQEDNDDIEQENTSKFPSLVFNNNKKGGLSGLMRGKDVASGSVGRGGRRGGGRGGLGGLGGLGSLGGLGGLGGGIGTSAKISSVELPFKKSGTGLGGLSGLKGSVGATVPPSSGLKNLISSKPAASASNLDKTSLSFGKSLSRNASGKHEEESDEKFAKALETVANNSNKTTKELCDYISQCMENSTAVQNSTAKEMCNYIS